MPWALWRRVGGGRRGDSYTGTCVCVCVSVCVCVQRPPPMPAEFLRLLSHSSSRSSSSRRAVVVRRSATVYAVFALSLSLSLVPSLPLFLTWTGDIHGGSNYIAAISLLLERKEVSFGLLFLPNRSLFKMRPVRARSWALPSPVVCRVFSGVHSWASFVGRAGYLFIGRTHNRVPAVRRAIRGRFDPPAAWAFVAGEEVMLWFKAVRTSARAGLERTKTVKFVIIGNEWLID